MIKTIIIALIMFEVLIVGHEFGHYITAKKVGIKVNEFSVGMGPAIFKHQGGETLYALRAFPIGGYVSMEGEDTGSYDERSFNAQSIPKKMLVVVAGAVMNYLMAIVILIIMAMIIGSPSTGIRDTVEGAPAEAAGIQAGDNIIAVDGVEVEEWEDITTAISAKNVGDTINFQVERDGKTVDIDGIEVLENESGSKYVGIYCAYERNIFSAIKSGLVGSVQLIKIMYQSLGMIFAGEVSAGDIVGPIGVVSIMGTAASQGMIYILYIAALISVNLAVINLLPLPALDGGRFFFLLLCAITRKELNPEIEGKIHYVGFMLLLALMVVITIKDVNQFIIK